MCFKDKHEAHENSKWFLILETSLVSVKEKVGHNLQSSKCGIQDYVKDHVKLQEMLTINI